MAQESDVFQGPFVPNVVEMFVDKQTLDAVNGGSIAIGHPFGMTGSRLTGLILRELKLRKKKLGIVSMCIGKGMGAAGLFEAC